MTLVVTQHVPFEGPAAITDWAHGVGGRIQLVRFWAGDELPDPRSIEGLVIMGGPMSIWDDADYPWLAAERSVIRKLLDLDRPVLGICLGAQQIAAALGAAVYPGQQKEIGFFPIEFSTGAFQTVTGSATTANARAVVFHWHGDTFDMPAGATLLARSPATPHQGFVVNDRVVALQFHLESTRESVALLASACSHEIGGGTYQTRRTDAVSTMLRDERLYGGACRTLLFGLLDRLFGAGER